MLDLVNLLATDWNSICGGGVNGIPDAVFNLTSLIIKGIQIVVPVLLIIWGMLDFAKAVIGGDEDKIKAAQKVFLKRLIAAVIVFLVVTVVKLVVNLIGNLSVEGSAGESNSIWNTCINKFINGAGAS